MDELAWLLPHLRELHDLEWKSEEREFVAAMARLEGRPLTSQEANLMIAQARLIGNL